MWNVLTVCSPQAWPFERSACVQQIHRLPVRREDQVSAGADLEPVAARLVAVEKKCLPYRVLVGARLDRHVGITQDIGRSQHVLPAVHHVREVMQPS